MDVTEIKDWPLGLAALEENQGLTDRLRGENLALRASEHELA